MRKRLVTVTAALIASALLAASSQAAELPVVYNGVLGYAQASSTASPPGANDFSCKPSKAHPLPVILVHGTFADMSDSWQALSPLLANHGYCVFALNYGSYEGSGEVGIYATGDIAQSAEQLGGFVTRVLSATGASKVDLVGHSQGGMMPRYYLRFLGGATKVHTLVGLSPSNHGTTVDGLPKPFSKAPRLTVYKRELYDCAECINLCLLLRREFPQLEQTLNKVVQHILDCWIKPDGSFRSRRLHFSWDNVPMHRWAQSQMFRSLAYYLCEEAVGETAKGRRQTVEDRALMDAS